MNINKKSLKLSLSIVLLLTSITDLDAKEYVADKNGNLNIEVSEKGVVRVNGKVESVVRSGEEITVMMDEHSSVTLGNDDMDMEYEEQGVVSIDDDEIAVDMEEIGVGDVFVDDDGVSVGDVYVGDDGISIGGIVLGD